VYLVPLVAVFGTIVYVLVDLRFDEVSVFFEAYAALYVTSVWYGFMAHFFATAFPNAQIADIFVGVFLNSVNLFNGLFASGVLNYSQTFRWIAYINPLYLVNIPLSIP